MSLADHIRRRRRPPVGGSYRHFERKEGPVHVFEMRGSLVWPQFQCEPLCREVERLLTEGARYFVVDLRGVVNLDCPIASELIRCYKRIVAAGGHCSYVLEEESDLQAHFISSGTLYGLPAFHDFDAALGDLDDKGDTGPGC